MNSLGRFNQLIAELGELFPNDWWIKAYTGLSSENAKMFSDSANVYSDALDSLDDDSWGYLRNKAAEYFRQDTRRRGKQPFFNILNEVLAYQYLQLQGFSVSLLKAAHESGGGFVGKRPDISFTDGAQNFFCEVKTVNSSEEDLDRNKVKEIFSGNVYSELSLGFLNKLTSNIETSIKQLPQENARNLVYVIINFDDWVGLHYDRYQEQIKQHLAVSHGNTQVYCRAGVRERFYVHHVPTGA